MMDAETSASQGSDTEDPSTSKPFMCSKCPKRFSNKYTVARHEKRHDEVRPSRVPGTYTCYECLPNRTFPTPVSLNSHRAMAHTPDTGPFDCPHCCRSFSRPQNLGRHVRLVHDPRIHVCPVCKQEFVKEASFRKHVRYHEENVLLPEGRYGCTDCGKSFRHLNKLKIHMRLHTGERPYMCEVCSKCFSTADTLYNHLRRHSGIKPYHCTQCDVGFSDRAGYTRHQKHVHEKVKKFECETCHKFFTHAYKLKNHAMTHSGERPHACDFCHKTFLHKKTLSEHHRTHTGEKPYTCDVCGNQFGFFSNLRLHKRVHNKKRKGAQSAAASRTPPEAGDDKVKGEQCESEVTVKREAPSPILNDS